MTAISVITLAGLLIGLTGTVLAADNRSAYFGHPNGTEAGNGVLDVSTVTAGNVFTVDVRAENLGNQSLTHSIVGIGSQATARPADQTTDPSLPLGFKVVGASASAGSCTFNDAGGSCDLGTLVKNAPQFVTFAVQASSAVGTSHIWASLRVAENNPDRGDNNNSFFADANLAVGPTNSDNNSTFKLSNQALTLDTKNQTKVPGDKMFTTVTVPDGLGGIISIVERSHTQTCPNTACIGQELLLNVRDGDELDPYLEWRLDIIGLGAGSNRGGIVHTDNNDNLLANIRFTKANMCSAKLLTDCFVEYTVDKKAGTTTIVFRTETNGKVRAN